MMNKVTLMLVGFLSSATIGVGHAGMLKIAPPDLNELGLHHKPSMKILTEGSSEDLERFDKTAIKSVADTSESVQLQLVQADKLMSAGRYEEAQAILMPIDIVGPSAGRLLKKLIEAEIALKRQSLAQAAEYLASIDLKELTSSAKELRIRYHRLRSQTFARQEKIIDSIRERVRLEPLLTTSALKTNAQQVWDELARVPTSILSKIQSNEPSSYAGWINLSLLTRQVDLDPKTFSKKMKQWEQAYPQHIALTILKDKEMPMTPGMEQPGKIALLLPLSGPHQQSAKAVHDGFVAAYYAYSTSHPNAPQLQVYDTEAGSDIESLYEQAVDEGAQLVVGPLLKPQVAALSKLSNRNLKVPLLALNLTDIVPNSDNFFQFSLAPEDEAKQLAKFAQENGYHNAIVVVANSQWSQRGAKAFVDQWRSMGHLVVGQNVLDPDKDNDFASHVRSLLQIDASQRRIAALKQVLQTKFEASLRRREDIDMIVLAISADQARQVKPLFDFYYANTVPVFGTSSVFSGLEDPKRDRDLNGIIFCDMPVLIDNQNRYQVIKKTILEQWPSTFSQNARLYALGLDAFQVALHLNRLVGFPQLGYQGATGSLVLNERRHIERSLPFAKIKNGVPVLIHGAPTP